MRGIARTFALALAVIGLIAAIAGTSWNLSAHDDRLAGTDLPVLRTESPQQTLASFAVVATELRAARDRYAEVRSATEFERILGLVDELTSLIDLSTLPEAAARRNGVRTAMALLEISERLPLVELSSVPDAAAMRNTGFTSYTVPNTPLRLTRMQAGAREGEFLFDASTIRTAPRVLNGLRSEGEDTSSTDWLVEFEQFAGPWIPASWIAELPPPMTDNLFGSPAWKVAVTAGVVLLLVLVMALVRAALPRSTERRLLTPTARLLYTASILPILLLLRHFFEDQLNLTGGFGDAVRIAFITVWYGALAAIFWNATLAWAAAASASRFETRDASDRSLMNLVAHIVGLVGAIWIAAYGLQSLGVPIFSLIAGLGIGGLAVALAVRPTLENLIGGLVIYVSKPVRVGDWCEFGARSGTVERIGVRSTSIRAMDRTLISIPNAQFANMELVNWARCDQMLIEPTIGLVYDTTSDQLRNVLAEARRMALSHPKIDSDTIRIRFVGYGESSLDISFRVYAQTKEWNEFYAVREDFLLRLKDIVEAAGTFFAFPSRSLYVTRMLPPDPEKSRDAENAVRTWRKHNEYPFPEFSEAQRRRFANTIAYPPEGSPASRNAGLEATVSDEPLSAEADQSGSNARDGGPSS